MLLKNIEEDFKEIIFNPEHENFWLYWKATLYIYENVGKTKLSIKDFLYIGKEASNSQYNLKAKGKVIIFLLVAKQFLVYEINSLLFFKRIN